MDKNIIKETMLSLEGAALQSARALPDGASRGSAFLQVLLVEGPGFSSQKGETWSLLLPSHHSTVYEHVILIRRRSLPFPSHQRKGDQVSSAVNRIRDSKEHVALPMVVTARRHPSPVARVTPVLMPPHSWGPGFRLSPFYAALAYASVMTVNRIIVTSGFCITALGAALAGDYAAASVSVAAALAQAVGL